MFKIRNCYKTEQLKCSRIYYANDSCVGLEYSKLKISLPSYNKQKCSIYVEKTTKFYYNFWQFLINSLICGEKSVNILR